MAGREKAAAEADRVARRAEAAERERASRLLVPWNDPDSDGRAEGAALEEALASRGAGGRRLTASEIRSIEPLMVLPPEERKGRLIGLADMQSRIKKHVLSSFNKRRLGMGREEREACGVHKLLHRENELSPGKYFEGDEEVVSGHFKPAVLAAAMRLDGCGIEKGWVDSNTVHAPTLRSSPNAHFVDFETLRYVDVRCLMGMMGFTDFDSRTARYLLGLSVASALALLGASQSLFSLKSIVRRLLRAGALGQPTERSPLRVGCHCAGARRPPPARAPPPRRPACSLTLGRLPCAQASPP